MVATSGDTGAAVAAAFHRRPGFRVVILYPDGRVSPRQAHQLGCFGDNVLSLRVQGSFDDCQRLAKAALGDAALRAQVPLSSANSISLGRLLPQMAYYAHASLLHWRATGRPLSFVVPTGNLGNGLACLMARRMGLPIGDIVLASNANDVLPRFFAGAGYAPQPSIATLANAMDVGAPSNFERLQWLYPDPAELRSVLRAEAVDDDAIRHAITKLSYLHFTAAEPYRQRVIQLGEEPERVFNVGAIGNEHLHRTKMLNLAELQSSLKFELKRPFFIVTYHPVTLADEPALQSFQNILDALEKFQDHQVILTYPNADDGGRSLIPVLENYARKQPWRVLSITSLGQQR